MIPLTRSPSVALLGEQAPPRVRYAPDARANSWEDVADLSSSFGLVLDPWQEAVLKAAMGERSSGKWAAHQVGLSVPRQNGKSQLIVARAIAGVLLFGERKVVISAHQQDTARETFGKFLELIESSPALESRIAHNGIMNAINREQIKFTNGAIIKFKARSGSGGRGFSSDCLFLDEAQILTPRAWASINSTMSAMPNPQVWLLGTPPTPEDEGEVFGRVRDSALAKKAQSLAWLEWGAERDDDPSLEETRAKANPAWSIRINHEVVQGEYETYSPEQFALERLGIWRKDLLNGVFDADEWAALEGEAPAGYRQSFGVKFSVDGARVSLATALRPEGEGPVFVEAQRPEPMSRGIAWLADWLAERWRDTACIVIDGKGGSLALASALRERGVKSKSIIVTPTTEQVIAAYAGLLDAVKNAAVAHSGQEGLASSVACAGRRDIGHAGGWGLTPITQDGDVGPTEAVALAVYGAMTSKRRPGRKAQYDF